jgi:hypothetical protein
MSVDSSDPRGDGRGGFGGLMRRIVSPVVSAVAIVYFVLDAVVLGILKPFLNWLGRQPVVIRLGDWIAALGPYPSLFLLGIPVVILEPLKPLGLYVIATGHPIGGSAILAGAEVAKVVVVERLFRICRDKLLTIRWFAWGYRLVTGWLDRIRALPAWQAVVRAVNHVKAKAREAIRWIRSAA